MKLFTTHFNFLFDLAYFLVKKRSKSNSKLAFVLTLLLAVVSTENLKSIDVSGSISSDVTWALADSPINFTGTVTVDVGATLTIEPGVEIFINNTGRNLDVYGTLIAIGTDLSHISFNSTSGNGGGSVAIRELAVANLAYVDFENLGIISLSFYDTGLYIYESDVTADNLTFNNCGLLGGTNHIVADANSVSGFGSNNQIEQVTLIGSSLDGDATWPDMDPTGFNYRLTGTQNVLVGTTLTIQPGVDIDFTTTGVNIDVDGTLVALGTSSEHITYYSSNSNGGGSLALRDGSFADLLYCDFLDLGRTSLSFYDAGLYIYETNLTADWLNFTNCGLLGGTRSITADANNLSGFGPNNQVDQVQLIGNTLSATTTWPNLDSGGFNYRLDGDQFVTDGIVLTIEPGVNIDLPTTGVDIEVIDGGILFMEGTSSEHISIYSSNANYGGSVALRDGAEGHIAYVDFMDLGRSSLSFFDAGLYLDDVDLTADYMTFDSCGWGALVSIEANADYVDGIGTNNSIDMVLLRGGVLSKDAIWPLMDPVDYYYQLEGDVFVPVGLELTIDPSNQIHFPNTGVDLEIQGVLNAIGTTADPIKMYSDNANGGGSLALHDQSSSFVEYVEFEDMGRSSLSFFDAGVYMYDCSLVADNLTFTNSGWGGTRSIDALPFTVDNIGPNNELDQIRLRGATVGQNATWPKVDQGVYNYIISGDVFVAEGFELIVDPGVNVHFENTGVDLEIAGSLKANGLADEKIHFTSSNSNGGGSIVFHTPSLSNELSYCMIDSLGKSSLSFWDAAIYTHTGELTIQKSRIVESLRGIEVEAGAPVIINNIIKDNSLYGIFNHPANVDVTACDNYWGDPTGPFNATNNPGGLGNEISDNVIAADCDADALEIVCPDNASVNVGDDYSPNELGSVEVCIQDCATLMSTSFVDSNADPQCTGDMIRTWTVVDDCGNDKSCDQIIDFTDIIDPTVVCPSNEILECNGALPAVDFGSITASDNCEIESLILDSEVEDIVGCVHTYTRTFIAEDPTGNSASCSYDISVKIDLEAPVFSETLADMTVNCSDYPVAPTVTAMDNCDGPVAVTFTEDISEDPCVLSVMRTWTAIDECGNEATLTQVITGDKGDIVLIGVPVNETVECTNLPVSVPTVTAADNCGAVSVSFDEVTAGVLCDGTITRTWTASDDCGNSASGVQVITVVKTGCSDPAACNYDVDASVDSGMCSYATGCDTCTGDTDGTGAVVDNPEVGESCDDGDSTTINDTYVDCGLCEGVTVPGCINEDACNYDEGATVDDGTCLLALGCDECDGAGGVTDNPEIGDACDDGDATTLNDMYTSCGVCGGTAILGCTNSDACNYDPAATVDDDTCLLAEGCDECDGIGGVTDNPEIGDTCDDGDATTLNDIYTSCGVCEGTEILGCTNSDACNYNPAATVDDGACVLAVGCDECDGAGGVTDNPEIGDACDDGDATTLNDVYTSCGVCGGTAILGCTDEGACNYDAAATVDDNGCVYALGCDECNGNGGVTNNPEIGEVCDDGDVSTINDVVQADCVCAGVYDGSEHTALTCSDGIDNDGDGLIDCEDLGCQNFNDNLGCSTCFGDGLSFADAVIEYSSACPGTTTTDPTTALGTPDYEGENDGTNFVSLGDGGFIKLEFTNNSLTNSGDNGPDLFVFEIGPLVESSEIELRPSNSDTEDILILNGLVDSDMDGFYEFGAIGGSTASVDIDGLIPGLLANTIIFDAIKITDVPGAGCVGDTPGADIDAVCALSSVPCAVGAACDDGDPLTVGEVLQPDCSCSLSPENNSVACSDGIDNDMNGLIDCEDPGCAGLSNNIGCSTCFEDGLSFADSVLEYFNNCPGNLNTNSLKALGVPDDGLPGNRSVSLGDGGHVRLGFDNNTLTNSGDSDADLFVFEVGPLVESSLIELRPINAETENILINAGIQDLDLDGYYEFGTIGGSTAAVDLDAIITGLPVNAIFFDAIKITDEPGSNCSGDTPGADIDAVCALSNIPCIVGEACDDGNPISFDDEIQADCTCQGTILGCNDLEACNYDDTATDDDGSCVYATGCDECDGQGGVADNPEIGDSCDDGDPETVDDVYTSCGVCGGETIPGCTNPDACNYDALATVDDDTCVLAEGCDECDGAGGVTDNPEIGESCDDGDVTTINDVYVDCGLCQGVAVPGCMNMNACNYDPAATVDDDTCVLAEGCDECDGAGGVTDNPEIGDSCDDGDVTTINDVYADCGLCQGVAVPGCMNMDACNYDPAATVDDDTCVLVEGCDECDGEGGVTDYPEIGESCDDGDATTINDVYVDCGLCQGVTVPGCMNMDACNYDPTATVDNDTCVLAEGCDECDGAGGVIDNPEIGDACDDGDAATLNDVYTACGVCGGTMIPGCTNEDACNYDEAATVDDDTCVLAEGCDECDGEGGVIDNPEIGDACDDGDATTLNDVYTDCGICTGDICDVESASIIPTSNTVFCNSDELDDTFTFDVVGGSGDEAFLFATLLDGTVLATLLVEDIDLNGGGVGEYLIYHMSFNGSPMLEGGSNINDFVGCYALSEPVQLSIVTGEDCPSEFDCPALDANIGDDCDDGNPQTTSDQVTDLCICAGINVNPPPANDEVDGAFLNTAERLWGVPGWDSYNVGSATLSMQACDGSSATSDTWYKFVAESENQGVLVRPNPSDVNASITDLAVEIFDASMTPLAGLTDGSCAVSRSCFNNAGDGEIERCVPGGLIIGDTYFYRVYDANGPVVATSLFIDTKVKTYADHGIVDGCTRAVETMSHTWTIEDPVNLYNIPPVPVIDVRMIIKDLSGNIVSTSIEKNPNSPGGLTFAYSDFSPALPDGDYTVHAQNRVKMMANGCVSAFWSQAGPGCEAQVMIFTNEANGDFSSLNSKISIEVIEFDVYPNPSTGESVNLMLKELSGEDQVAIVEVYDAVGKRIVSRQLTANGTSLQYELNFDTKLSGGLYMIQVNVQNTKLIKKLIIE